MKKTSHLIIVGIVGFALASLLFFLPRSVVKDKDTGENSQEVAVAEEDSHIGEIQLSDETIGEIKSKKDSLANGLGERESLLLGISSVFEKQSLFDSAGFYANLAGEELNSLDLINRSGDLYFQAYSLSLDPMKREKLAEKTREQYDKVLKSRPRDLHARTNKAMTFVSSDAPMQAIMLLRQVLDDEPRYIPALMSLGALSMQSGQFDKAVSRFEDVLKIDPENIRGKLGLAYSLLETEGKSKGIDLLKNLLSQEIDPVLRNEIENTLKNIK